MKDQKLQTINKTRALLVKSLIFATLVTVLCWLVLYSFFSPVLNMEEPLARIIFALKCWAIAALFTVVLGIKAVAYERLGNSVVSALGDGDSLGLKINQRYLQQTIEQMWTFTPGLLILAIYCDTPESMRLVEVATMTWIALRFLFWLSYHQDIQSKIPGMMGMLQNSLILLYGSARFSYEMAGITGTVLTVAFFISMEIYLLGVNKL